MRLLRWFSPWHRGYRRGYQEALDNVAAGRQAAVDLATQYGLVTQYGSQTLEDATRVIAQALGGRP